MHADGWGVDDGYFDVGGTWHPTEAHLGDELRAAMGAGVHPDGPPSGPPLWFVRQGDAPALHGPAALVLEDATGLRADDHLPPDLPLGYHDLHPLDGGPVTRLIVTPARSHLPDGLRTWAWAIQVYGLRSASSWGIGDLGDVAAMGAIAATQGAHFATLSPLHAPGPLLPQQPSPYFPSSRRWRSPLLLRVEEVPGAAELTGVAALLRDGIAAAGRALNDSDTIDRDQVWVLKRTALQLLWERHRVHPDPTFEAWQNEQGDALTSYASHEALAEHHGTSWPNWPERHRHPANPAVRAFAAEHRDAVHFHAWVQWLIDRQLARAGQDIGLIADLAVGAAPDGADAWRWQDLQASGVRIGAPPDAFNPAGQDWGLPPFTPWALRAAHYEPFVEVLRGVLRHAAGVRIDHVMGLFRQYWIPEGRTASEGGYVRYRSDELLDLLALESVRARALVVGEDLGTVEAGVREDLAARGLLSTRLVWFEPEPPSQFPQQCLAAITTHDLPTVAGLLDGTDAADRQEAGQVVRPEEDEVLRDHLASAAAESPETTVVGTRTDSAPAEDASPSTTVAAAVHRSLSDGPAMLVAATLEDVLGVKRRPNLPGTVDEHPNWRQRLPVPVEDLAHDPGVLATVAAFEARRAHGTGPR